MKRIVIFGISLFAKLMRKYIEGKKDCICVGYTVDKEYIVESIFDGLPIIPFEEIENYYLADEIEILVAIGYKNMNTNRENIFKRIKEKNYFLASYTHPTATILTDSIGEGCIILENVTIGIGCKIGEGNIFNACSMIGHDTKIGNYNFFAGNSTIGGAVIVKNNCFLGLNCTVRNEVVLNKYTLVGACAYIDRDTNERAVYVPAKSIELMGKISIDMNI